MMEFLMASMSEKPMDWSREHSKDFPLESKKVQMMVSLLVSLWGELSVQL